MYESNNWIDFFFLLKLQRDERGKKRRERKRKEGNIRNIGKIHILGIIKASKSNKRTQGPYARANVQDLRNK